jgi:pilus assembly protein CpaB
VKVRFATVKTFRAEWLIGVGAIVAGLSGALFASRYIAQRATAVEQRYTQRYASRSIVVAANDIKAGESLGVAALAARSVPAAFAPEDAVASDQVSRILATRAAIDIKRGSPIQLGAVRAANPAEGLAAAVDGGRRAVTIAVDQVNSLDGQLSAGDYVDIFYSRAEGGDATLSPLLQRVQILAAAGRISGVKADGLAPSDESIHTITLSLTSNDAARLLLAEQTGLLSVLLRSPSDDQPVNVRVRHSRQLQEAVAPARPGVLRQERIELLVGGGAQLDRRWMVVGSAASTRPEESL